MSDITSSEAPDTGPPTPPMVLIDDWEGSEPAAVSSGQYISIEPKFDLQECIFNSKKSIFDLGYVFSVF